MSAVLGAATELALRLAKAKVAGSNPVFRSNSKAGFIALSALGPAFSLRQ